jgi:hypothetical protein
MWNVVKDGNPVARALFSRHYTYNHRREQMSLFWQRNRNYGLFVGPGEKLVLLATDTFALFVWRKFRSMDHQEGVNCAVFRNEGPTLTNFVRLPPTESLNTFVGWRSAARSPNYSAPRRL